VSAKNDNLRSPMQRERRSGQRVVNVLQFATISVDDKLQPCVVVNMGSGGLQLRLHQQLALEGPVEIGLRGGVVLRGSVAWQTARAVGISFSDPLTESEYNELLVASGPGTRVPRIPLQVKGMARSGATLTPFVMVNVSPAGAGLLIDEALPFEGAITLILPRIGAIPAQIRWRRDSTAGVVFSRPLLGTEIVDLLDVGREGAIKVRLW